MENSSLIYLAQLSYLLTLLSYSVRNINWLRILAVLASVVAIFYSASASPEPLWVPILWNALFTFANLTHLALSRWRARDVSLNPLEEFLSQTVLANFPPAEVRSFAALASEGELQAGAQLIRTGTKIENLYCLLKGNVDVVASGKKVAQLGPGRFVGEMSLLTKSLTRADVFVADDIKALIWTHDSISNWVDSDASRLALLQTALGTQVVEELLRQQSEEARV